jgi:hypothetical protein
MDVRDGDAIGIIAIICDTIPPKIDNESVPGYVYLTGYLFVAHALMMALPVCG